MGNLPSNMMVMLNYAADWAGWRCGKAGTNFSDQSRAAKDLTQSMQTMLRIFDPRWFELDDLDSKTLSAAPHSKITSVFKFGEWVAQAASGPCIHPWSERSLISRPLITVMSTHPTWLCQACGRSWSR